MTIDERIKLHDTINDLRKVSSTTTPLVTKKLDLIILKLVNLLENNKVTK